jgi:hypothetical protein
MSRRSLPSVRDLYWRAFPSHPVIAKAAVGGDKMMVDFGLQSLRPFLFPLRRRLPVLAHSRPPAERHIVWERATDGRNRGSCPRFWLAISFSAPQLAQRQLWRAGRRYPQPAKPLGSRRDRSTVPPPPVLARRDPAIPGLHSRSPPSGPPVFTGKWATCRQALARNRFPFTVTTPQPVTRRPARSQPRARARKTRPAAALLPT